MAKDISKIIVKTEDEAGWESILEASDSKLVVVDCHQDWCGCCEAMHPTISRVLLDYDAVEERFVYAAASIGKLGAKLQASFPQDAHVNLEKNGCLPLFAVYRARTCVSVVVGVDAPTLLQQIAMNIPEKPVKEQ